MIECYIFLIRFCRGNQQNQAILHEHLESYDLTNPAGVFLIQEIFRHNKKFLFQNVQKIIKQIVKLAEDCPVDTITKSSYMKVLKVFVKYRNKIVKPNQTEIVILLTSGEIKQDSVLPLLKSIDGQERVNQILQDMDTTADTINIDPIIFNIISFLEIITICTEGRNEITEAKAQTSVMDLQGISTMLKESE